MSKWYFHILLSNIKTDFVETKNKRKPTRILSSPLDILIKTSREQNYRTVLKFMLFMDLFIQCVWVKKDYIISEPTFLLKIQRYSSPCLLHSTCLYLSTLLSKILFFHGWWKSINPPHQIKLQKQMKTKCMETHDIMTYRNHSLYLGTINSEKHYLCTSMSVQSVK